MSARGVLFVAGEARAITSADGSPAPIDVVVQLQREHGRWRVFRQLWLVHPPPAEHRREALAWLGAVGAGQRVSGAPARAAGPR